MTAILAYILANPTVIAIVGGIAAALGWGWKQRRAGAAAERARQADAELRARYVKDDVQNDIGSMTPEQRREALREWER